MSLAFIVYLLRGGGPDPPPGLRARSPFDCGFKPQPAGRGGSVHGICQGRPEAPFQRPELPIAQSYRGVCAGTRSRPGPCPARPSTYTAPYRTQCRNAVAPATLAAGPQPVYAPRSLQSTAPRGPHAHRNPPVPDGD